MTNGRVYQQEAVYRITVQGNLEEEWAAQWFRGFAVTWLPENATILTGPVADQAALHGLLARIRDLGLPLIAIDRVSSSERRRI